MGVFLLAAIILAVTGHLTDNLAWRRLSPAIAGFLFAGGFSYLAGQSRFIRHRFLAGLSLISGVAMVVPPIDEPYGNFRVWALVMGLVCLVIGAWVLHRFVRDNPVVEERVPDE